MNIDEFQKAVEASQRERAEVERQSFESWAEGVFGGKADRYFERDSHFPDDYKYADVHMAWKAWLYRSGVAGGIQ